LSVWRAAKWSIVIGAVLLIPYYAMFIYEFLYAAPEQGITFAVELPRETAEQRLEVVRRALIGMPFMLAMATLLVFVVLAPIFLLGRIVQRHLLLPLRPPER
jgi:hypothetical protein